MKQKSLLLPFLPWPRNTLRIQESKAEVGALVQLTFLQKLNGSGGKLDLPHKISPRFLLLIGKSGFIYFICFTHFLKFFIYLKWTILPHKTKKWPGHQWWPGLVQVKTWRSRARCQSTETKLPWRPPVGLPGGISGKEPACQCTLDIRDAVSIPGSGRSPGGAHGNLLQCSCLQNPRDRGAWRSTVHGVSKSWTQLKWLCMHTHNRGHLQIREDCVNTLHKGKDELEEWVG